MSSYDSAIMAHNENLALTKVVLWQVPMGPTQAEPKVATGRAKKRRCLSGWGMSDGQFSPNTRLNRDSGQMRDMFFNAVIRRIDFNPAALNISGPGFHGL